MDASMWVAKTGLTAQSTKMTVIANNLANVNTVGFKKDRAMFEELLYQTIAQAGGQTDATNEDPTGFMLGTGTRIISTEKIHAQGNMISTENSFDLAVSGDGFFARYPLRGSYLLVVSEHGDAGASRCKTGTFRSKSKTIGLASGYNPWLLDDGFSPWDFSGLDRPIRSGHPPIALVRSAFKGRL